MIGRPSAGSSAAAGAPDTGGRPRFVTARFAVHLRLAALFTCLLLLAFASRMTLPLLGYGRAAAGRDVDPGHAAGRRPGSAPADRVGVEGQGRGYRFSCRVTYRNITGRAVRVHLRVPLPESRGARQSAFGLRADPPPRRVVRDRAGNLLAEFVFPRVSPGRTVAARVRATVRTDYWLHDVDARKVVSGARRGPDLTPLLAAEPRYPAADPLVARRVKEVLGEERNPYFQALKIYDSIRMLHFRMSDGAATVLAAMRRGTVQCSDAAAMFVTMARSAGIPARYCAGVVARDLPGPLEGHAWAEFFLDGYGWLPVDPTMGRFDDLVRLSRFGQVLPGYVQLWSHRSDVLAGRCESVDGRRVVQPSVPLHVVYECQPDGATASAPLHERATKPEVPGTVLSVVGPWQAVFPLPAPELGSGEACDAHGESALMLLSGLNNLKVSDFSKAASNLEGALSQEDSVEAHLDLAVFLVRSKQVSRAFEELRVCIERQPDNYTAWHELINLYAALELWDAVAAAAYRAAPYFPDEVEFPSAAGQANLRLRRFERAREDLARSVRLSGSSGWLHAQYGWSLMGCGQKRQALAEVREGLRLGVPEGERPFYQRMEKRLAAEAR